MGIEVSLREQFPLLKRRKAPTALAASSTSGVMVRWKSSAVNYKFRFPRRENAGERNLWKRVVERKQALRGAQDD
jgi:hypothetical protein